MQAPPADIPDTGPEAILHALSQLNIDDLENEQREVIRSGAKTKRARAVRILNIARGLKRNQIEPKDFMVNSVPVVPPRFRPFAITGETFLPGDANEVYRDVLEYRRLYQDTEKSLGREAAAPVYTDMVAAVKAAYGYGESPNPKTRAREVKGFFQALTGSSPKYSWLQQKMLAKPVDTVGRGVIIPDADLGMDEVGVPEDMAWRLYGRYIQRRLVRGGMTPGAALRHISERTDQARKQLLQELNERPAIISRAPAWHKYNTLGQNVRLTDGDAIRINTFITEGQNADFDGDAQLAYIQLLRKKSHH
jgi:DNA-directed RNA polymerase beta' subunit